MINSSLLIWFEEYEPIVQEFSGISSIEVNDFFSC